MRGTARSDTRKRPLVGRVAAKPTFDRQIEQVLRSCLTPAHWRCADRGAAREDVDDDHRCSAVPADEDGAGFDDGVIRWRADLGCDVQQVPHLRETGAAHRVGEQPVVTDPMEATRQHMEQEAAHEFASFEGHGLVAGASLCTVVLPAERHAALIEGDQALVGDGDAVRVA